jgi:uncharacterized cupin superfamily protein
MKRPAQWMLCLAASLLCAAAVADSPGVADASAGAAPKASPKAPPAAAKPVKLSSAEALGPVFARPGVVRDNGADGPTTDYSLLKSRDHRFEAGVYAAGPSDQQIASYEDDEFMFFLEGGVTLTSADGTVLEAQAGDAVVVPKGWKGRWVTQGYKKYYVTYTGGRPPR